MKKFNLLMIGLAIGLTTLVLTNCNKKDELKNDDPSLKGGGWTNPYNYLGEWHNDGAQYILENMKYIPSGVDNIESYVADIYEDWLQAKGTFGCPDMPKDIEDLDLYEWVDELSGSLAFKELITNTLKLLESNPGLRVIQDSVAVWEVRASRLLSGTELDKYYQHLALAKYSAYFWSPKEEGGLNGLKYLDVGQLKSTMYMNWWKVFGCDCIGGLVTGTPIGYLGASCISVIMQL